MLLLLHLLACEQEAVDNITKARAALPKGAEEALATEVRKRRHNERAGGGWDGGGGLHDDYHSLTCFTRHGLLF
jgi:hypothetical protein